MEVRFLADTMLGKLAKWLRIMGYDTHYEAFYGMDSIDKLVKDGRLLLSRHRQSVDQFHDSLFIRSDRVKEQLQEIRNAGYLTHDRSKWFLRCLICNVPLKETAAKDAALNIPDMS